MAVRPADAAVRALPGLSFEWPPPPFFRLGPTPTLAHACEVVVELMNGDRAEGELIALDEGHAVTLRPTNSGTPRSFPMDDVRMVRLRHALDFIPDDAALKGVGATVAQVASDKPFALVFADGRKLNGKTRGFLKSRYGLFLYLLDSASAQTIPCFIPRDKLQEMHIGTRLGETLQRKGLADEHAVIDALKRQAEQRHERLGDYLTRRAIVSPQQLTQVLKDQRHRPNVRLGELLLEARLVTREDLERALTIQVANRKRRLGDILVSIGVVSLRAIQRALSEALGIPYVDVRDFAIDPTALELVESAIASQHQVLPLLRTRDTLVVAVDNALNFDFEHELRFVTGLKVVPVIGDPDDIRARIASEYAAYTAAPAQRVEDRGSRDLSQIPVQELASKLAREAPQAAPAHDIGSEMRVTDNALVRLVNKIIVDAHACGASDIHIEASPGVNTRIRFRQDGDLEDYLELAPAYSNALVSRIKIMAGLDISEHRHAQDGKINFARYGPLPIELRVAIVPTSGTAEDVVMRLLGGMEMRAVDQLDLSKRDLAELMQMIQRSYGLILVCGPTGSGKTTTLHSVLHHINRPDLKIWTAEDPVEITQPGLRQVQVNAKIGWTFAAAMRSFLRADPDVIMVGEMRDAETTRIGIEASLTGHLVFSTLHTNSAAESVVRLLDLGMDPFNFADALIGILAQRLARRLCPHCKKAHAAGDDELSALATEFCLGTSLDPVATMAEWRREFARDAKVLLYEAVGCPKCDKGHKGRIGIYELLSASPEVRHLVRSHGTVPQLVASAIGGGMRLLKQDALLKALSGHIDLAGARAATS